MIDHRVSSAACGVVAAVIWGSLTLLPCPARAANDLVGTRAAGMGGALRASAAGSAAVLVNPAGMSLAKQYVMNGLYQFRSSDSAHHAQASIMDSSTTAVAAGLSYSYVNASPDRTLATEDGGLDLEESEQTHEVGLSLSLPLGQWLLFGLTTKYINYKARLADAVPGGLYGPSLSTVGLDVGAIIRLGDSVRVAAVGHNVVPVHEQLYPQQLGLGAAISPLQWLTAEFDSVIDFTSDPGGVSANFHGGLEGFFGNSYAVRLGTQHNMFRQATHLAAGAAFMTPQFGFDVSLQQQVAGGKATTVVTSMQFFVSQ